MEYPNIRVNDVSLVELCRALRQPLRNSFRVDVHMWLKMPRDILRANIAAVDKAKPRYSN